MKCRFCKNEAKYNYEKLNLCGDCLFDLLVREEKIESHTEPTWYLDGEYIGDTCNGLTTCDHKEIAEHFGIEEIKSE